MHFSEERELHLQVAPAPESFIFKVFHSPDLRTIYRHHPLGSKEVKRAVLAVWAARFWVAFLEGIGRISVLLKTGELAQYLVGEGGTIDFSAPNCVIERQDFWGCSVEDSGYFYIDWKNIGFSRVLCII